MSEFDRLYRSESAAITARLIRVLGGDFALAEEVVQEAFAAALEQWPAQGSPEHPRAWLIQTAQHQAFDRLRRARRFETSLGDAELTAFESEATLAASSFSELAKNDPEKRFMQRRLQELVARIGNAPDT